MPGDYTAVYTSTANGLDHYRHADWLGSNRLASSPSRTVLSTVAYAPFGETYVGSGTPDLSFTGQNPDTISNEYDFLYREYSNQGRWPSPDPAGLYAVDPTTPQSWNRYAYVFGSPLNGVDPAGLFPCPTLASNACALSQYQPHLPNLWGVNSNAWDEFDVLAMILGQGQTTDVASTINGVPAGETVTLFPGDLALLNLIGAGNGSNASGFFGRIKDKFLDFLAAHANYLPGVCTAGAFGFGTGGLGNAKGGLEGGVLVNKQLGQPTTAEPIGEAAYGPVGVGITPSETLVFVQPNSKVPAGVVFAANPQNSFINNSGISIGFFAGKAGHGSVGGVPAAGGFGGGAYLTFSSAANCVKNF